MFLSGNDSDGLSLFAEEFRTEINEIAKKTKDPSLASEQQLPISYLTTFLPLDYMNGMRVTNEMYTDDKVIVYDSLGLSAGSINMFIGPPGCGKSTFAIQAATAITQRFKNSVILHEDLETATSKSRIRTISGWNSRHIQNKYIIRDEGISTDSFHKRVQLHCEQKLKLYKERPEDVTYFTGLIDIHGKPVYRLIPTVVILDSLPLLNPLGITKEEELAGNMSAAQVAKLNKQVFSRLTPLLKAANVLLFVINHINQNISINMFQPAKAQINYLKQNESLPGGTAALYLANNIFKFSPSTKLTKDKDYGIAGFQSKVTIIKSRTNRAGQEVPMVYDQEYGFSKIWSAYQMLKDNGFVRGSGAWFYLEGMPNVKFQQKNLLSKLEDSESLRRHFRDLVEFAGSECLSGAGIRKTEMTEDEIGLTLANSIIGDMKDGTWIKRPA